MDSSRNLQPNSSDSGDQVLQPVQQRTRTSLQHKSVPPTCSTNRLGSHRDQFLPVAPLSKLSQKAGKEKQTTPLRVPV